MFKNNYILFYFYTPKNTVKPRKLDQGLLEFEPFLDRANFEKSRIFRFDFYLALLV